MTGKIKPMAPRAIVHRLFLAFLSVAACASAQPWTSPYASPTATGDCSGLTSGLTSGFSVTVVVSRALHGTGFAWPMKMAFDLNESSGLSDIYITQRYGDIQYYNSQTQVLTNLGKVPGVWSKFYEDGLGGIALDPDFKNNRRIYVSYSYRGGDTSTSASPATQSQPSSTVGLRVSRFTLDATTKMMDTSTHKEIIHIPAAMGERYHTGGSLRFDHFGHLYISAGDNEALFMGPGNTADLRGSILRILPGENGGYTIPDGNFGEYWAQVWEDSGLVERASEYRNTTKVRPEIYIKGTRNPYVFGLDPNVPGRISWAECGPDNQRREEQNISDRPAFSGFPFWAGDTVRQKTFNTTYNETGDINSTALYGLYNDTGTVKLNRPINRWPGADSLGIVRLGVDTLPPMHAPSSHWHNTAPTGSGSANTCAMGGPIIRYDSRIVYSGKMPPHLDNTILWGDFMGNRYWMMKIDTTTGKATGSVAEVFPSGTYPRSTSNPAFGRHIDLQQGPDGALYLLNHGAGCCNVTGAGTSNYTGIVRIAYTGSCVEPNLQPVVAVNRAEGRGRSSWLKVRAGTVSIRAPGPHAISIFDAKGRRLHAFRAVGPRDYALPVLAPGGVYLLRAESPKGTLTRMLGRP